MIASLSRALLALSLIGLLPTPEPAFAQSRPRIERAADLPRFSYRIDGKVDEIVRSAERFAPIAAAMRRDVESVLAGYEIPDKATQRELLNQLAVLDMLDGQWARAHERAEQVRALQDKPADKLVSGLRLRVISQAARQHPVGSDAFRGAVGEILTRELAALPFAVVQNDVREIKAGAETAGEGLVLGRLREVLQPIVDQSGSLSSEFAPQLVFARYALQLTLPLRQVFVDGFTRYLAAHTVAKPDLWAGRDVALPPGAGHQPVRIAIWDSGTDTRLYGDRVLRDAQGRALVIAFDKYSRPASGELQPLPAGLRDRVPALMARTKGMSDLQSNIDSPEAAEVRQYLSTLAPEAYKAAVEELGLIGNYTHGTHVAGIALAGNPHARLLVARIEFGHTLKPDPCPSLDGAKRDARAMRETVRFLQRHRARVVNMSWGGNVTSIEGDLEQCGIGNTADERKALARRIFEIGKRALADAMARAPRILFVTAAGNDANDATFTESIPSGIVLPNLLTVGAVDQAGDEASFTSYGPTVKVHANGYQVVSDLPGGDRVALSGTSMAAPQVAGLAAKLLAVNPRLQPRDLVRLIVDTAERTPDGRRNLLHPKRALDAARAARVAGRG